MSDMPKFMSALHKAMQRAKSQGGEMGIAYQRLSGILNKVVGANATYLAKGNWEKAEGAMSKLDKVALTTQRNIQALTAAVTKSYKTGLTKGDMFTRMLEQQEAAIFKLSERHLDQWIQDHKRGFETLRGTLGKMAAKDGVVGELTKRLLLVQRVGLSGMFTGMSGLAPLINNTVTQMLPMLTAFAHLGASLGMIGKLLLPGGIILVGMAMFHEGLRKKLIGGVERTFEYLKKNIPKWWPKLRDGMVIMWKKAIAGIRWLMDVLTPLMNSLAAAIEKVDWGALTVKVINYVGKFFRGIYDAIFSAGFIEQKTTTTEGRFKAAGMRLVGAIGSGMIQAAKAVGNAILNFFFDWSDGLEEGLEQKGKLIGGLFVTALFFGSTRALLLKGIGSMMGLMLTPIGAVVTAILGAAAAIYIFRDEIGSALSTVVIWIQDTAESIWKYLKWPFDFLFGWLEPMIGAIQSLFQGDYVGFFKGMAHTIFNWLTWPFQKLVEYLGIALDAASRKVSEWYDNLKSTFFTGVEVVKSASSNMSNSIIDFVNSSINNYNSLSDAAATSSNSQTKSISGIQSEAATTGSVINDTFNTAWKNAKDASIDSSRVTVKAMAAVARAVKGAGADLSQYETAIKGINALSKEAGQIGRAAFSLAGIPKAQQREVISTIQKYRSIIQKEFLKMGFRGVDIERIAEPRFMRRFKELKVRGIETKEAARTALQSVRQRMLRRVMRGLVRRYTQQRLGGMDVSRSVYAEEKKKARAEILKAIMSGRLAGKEIIAEGGNVYAMLGAMGLYGTGKEGAKRARESASRARRATAMHARTVKRTKISTAPAGEAIARAKDREIEKKQIVEKQLSEETKTAMKDISFEIAKLSSALVNFSRGITVNVVPTNELRRLLRFAKNASRMPGTGYNQGVS
jgi:hypothetical protein